MTQPPAAGLLTLVQWLSPAFPTGGFAYSHGLEQVVTDGIVRDGTGLGRWLGDVLRHGAGRQDAILLSAALRRDADHGRLAAMACALAPSAERLSETCEQGAAFARTVSAVTGRALPPRPLPVALGEAASPLGLPAEQVIGLYLHAFASNLVSAAVRFVPLGQNDGQSVLAALHPRIAALAAEAVELDLCDLTSAALGADLAAMRHETMEVRIFKT
jgi:urease accessory protein